MRKVSMWLLVFVALITAIWSKAEIIYAPFLYNEVLIAMAVFPENNEDKNTFWSRSLMRSVVEMKDINYSGYIFHNRTYLEFFVTNYLYLFEINSSIEDKDYAMSLISEAISDRANIDQLDKFRGVTVLHDAIIANNYELVLFLLENGASCQEKIVNSESALNGLDAVGLSKKLRSKNYEYNEVSVIVDAICEPVN